jgi:muramidase (phage lysozyme)
MDPKLRAFLDLIGWSEGTTTHPLTKDDGYDVIVTGLDGMHVFSGYETHPFEGGRAPIRFGLGEHDLSTASGRYQQLLHNWEVYKVQLHLPDFGHESQDKIALQEMRECHALQALATGDLRRAIMACGSRWASFPGEYDQGKGPHSVETLAAKYADLLKSVHV